MSRTPEIPRAIKKLVPRLASNFDGEVVATARAIERSLKNAGCDWHDLTKAIFALEPKIPDYQHELENWQEMRQFCLAQWSRLRPNEIRFLTSLGEWHGDLAQKQNAWLTGICARLRS